MGPRRAVILLGAAATLICLGVMIWVAPFPQPQAYHAFADQRVLAGIPHVGDVLSNVAFLVVGLWCLWTLHARRRSLQARQVWLTPYLVFAVGLTAVAFGSTYYHWAPRNEALFWDRLPMSVAFMALLASFVASRISVRAGKFSLWPLVVLGAGTVVYWRVTDDLRPYFLMQGLLAMLIVTMGALLPPRDGLSGRHLYALAGFYVAAVVLEQLDKFVWTLLSATVSGHNLKHVVAAVACAAVVLHIRKISEAS